MDKKNVAQDLAERWKHLMPLIIICTECYILSICHTIYHIYLHNLHTHNLGQEFGCAWNEIDKIINN
jgi:hypothetical protein